jgi:glycosyltransferase involved in cell wall biosynthesis
MTGSFVQIHYHNRPGGVTSVMGQYGLAFSKACGSTAGASFVVCAKHHVSTAMDGAKVIDVRECGYTTFRTKNAFIKTRNSLLKRLEQIVTSDRLARPVCVVGHNMNLGKNCALSSAFAQCARRLAKQKNDYRFFSVVHDFAEEGRTDLMSQIVSLERLGIKIWDELYPVSPNLCFVALNNRNYSILKKAGFQVRLVPNPVFAPATARPLPAAVRNRVVRRLAKCAEKDNTAFKPDASLLVYPARIISRKNPVEAILLAHFFFSSNLLLGESGTSIEDRALAAYLKRLCRTHKIPVIFNSGRAAEFLLSHDETPFSLLTKAADVCITTSVLEGFGYALYEPRLYHKAVVGRVPAGSDVQKKIAAAGLYSRLFIPCGWVDIRKLTERYYRDMGQYKGEKNKFPGFESFSKQFNRVFIAKGGIDFGCLDIVTQCAVLEGLCAFQDLIAEWKRAFPFQTKAIMDSWRAAVRRRPMVAGRNRKRVISLFGRSAFAASFAACFEKILLADARVRPGAGALRKRLCSLDTFRQLTTPQFPLQGHYCTIFA